MGLRALLGEHASGDTHGRTEYRGSACSRLTMWKAEPQVHDRAIVCGREVHDLADGGGVFVSGDDEGAWLDLGGLMGLVEEGPDVAGLIPVVEVSGDVDAVRPPG